MKVVNEKTDKGTLRTVITDPDEVRAEMDENEALLAYLRSPEMEKRLGKVELVGSFNELTLNQMLLDVNADQPNKDVISDEGHGKQGDVIEDYCKAASNFDERTKAVREAANHGY